MATATDSIFRFDMSVFGEDVGYICNGPSREELTDCIRRVSEIGGTLTFDILDSPEERIEVQPDSLELSQGSIISRWIIVGSYLEEPQDSASSGLVSKRIVIDFNTHTRQGRCIKTDRRYSFADLFQGEIAVFCRGPNREELFDALKFGRRVGVKWFKRTGFPNDKSGDESRLEVIGLEREPGLSSRWMVKGYIDNPCRPVVLACHTDERMGTMCFIKPEIEAGLPNQ